jgi:hypothetical protein
MLDMLDEDLDEGLSSWGRLRRGKTTGKSVNILLSASGSIVDGIVRTAPTDMFTVNGKDDDAIPMTVTIPPIRAFDQAITGPPAGQSIQDLQGSYDTVQLIKVATNTLAPLNLGNPIIILEWGVGGVSSEAEVDVINGACINLTANFVRARAAIEQPGRTGVIYNIRSFIGPGRPKDRNAQRTLGGLLTHDGVTTNVLVTPRFAKTVYIAGSNSAGVGGIFTGSLRFWRDPTLQTKVADYFFNGNQPVPFPVPNGGYYFTLTPDDGNALMNAVFDLAI